MSHTVHPYSHRLGIIRDWKSRWFGVDADYRQNLKCDIMLREWLQKKMRGQYVSSVEMERDSKALRLIIKTSRPGFIIGRSGDGITKLRAEIEKKMKKLNVFRKNEELKIDVEEVKSPESNASIVAQMVSEGLEKRMPFRRILKQTVEKVSANRDVLGVKISMSGRLGGAEMARHEVLKKGRIPLQTFRADIDYAHYEALLTYGKIGIKVWVYKGEIFNK